MVERAYYHMLQGGVTLTMTKIRRRYWIPKLRQLTKRIIRTCHAYQRLRTTAYVAPIPGQLLPDRTNGRRSFYVIGLDFVRLIIYKGKRDPPRKAYVLLITCNLSRAAHRELVGSHKIEEHSNTSQSDNAMTFKAATTWIKSIRKSELIDDCLVKNCITCQFNLNKAPWWGISLNEWLI